MTSTERSNKILEIARRREVTATDLARALSVDVDTARRDLQRLRRAKSIVQTSKPIRNFYGSTDAGYRAV